MDEADYSPDWYYYVLLFSLIFLWTLLSIEIIQFAFSIVISNIINWFLVSSLLILTYPLPLAIVLLHMKSSTEGMDPTWNFQERFILLSEFIEMNKEYRRKYVLFTSRMDYPRLLVIIVICIVSIFVPFFIELLSVTLLIFLPQIFGGLMMTLGIALIAFLIVFLPSPLDEEFLLHDSKQMEIAMKRLLEIPALSWLGVRIDIAKWIGYYALRSPLLAGKIEEMESVVTLLFDLDEQGKITEISVRNESSMEFPSYVQDVVLPSNDDIIDLLRKIVTWYARESNQLEFLDDVLTDLQVDRSKLKS